MAISISFLIFFSTALFILSSIHYYLWRKIVKDTGIKNKFKIIFTILFIGLALFFPVSGIMGRIFDIELPYALSWFLYLWLGIMMLLFFSFLCIDLIRIIFKIFLKLISPKNQKFNIKRRRFISKTIAACTSISVFGLTGAAVENALSVPEVVNIKISLKDLPEVFKGFKIIQLSDLHIGKMMTGEFFERIVKKVNNLNPDLIVITGDLVDGSVSKVLNRVKHCKNLTALHGVCFVTGNHEYYSGAEEWIKQIRGFGIRVLNNETIKIFRGNEYFYLSGVPDNSGKNFIRSHKIDCDKTFSGIDQTKNTILLAHQPAAVKKVLEYDVDLILSGHTHGGQIWPFSYFVYLQQPYLKGLHRINRTHLYINQGTGTWGPQMRIGSFNEITEIILT